MWESKTALVYHKLALAYYLYHWAIIAGGLLLAVAIKIASFPLEATAIGTVLATAVICVGVGGFFSATKRRLQVINPSLDIVALTDIYVVGENSHYGWRKLITVRARHHGIDTYKTKYRWSGSGPPNIRIVQDGFSISDGANRVGDAWEFLIIRFPSPLRKGQELSFEMNSTFEDVGHTARAFYQKLIDDNYRNGLCMKVVLPKPPSNVRKEILLSVRSEIAIWETNAHEGDNTISWFIRRPLIGRKYRMTWTAS